MQLAELGYYGAVHHSARGAAGVVVVGGLRVVVERGRLEGVENGLDIAFQVEERKFACFVRTIDVGWKRPAGCTQADLLGLERFGPVGFIDVSGFEQADVVAASIQVVSQHVQHAGDERSAHDGGFFAHRIGERECRCRREARRVFGRYKRERDCFVVAESEQGIAQLRVFGRVRQLDHRAGECGESVRET